ncbi:hypothetical protein DV711_06450 [Motiliproteus coralliicola]|uniref:Uncharacterized protein n=1 Tax=Motiliproteus coralliicola TaxID=2283196 RepID=A0A369WVP9_9GAMM|nr:hypothetical protein [Motiliproteus coralliicola]RDE25193.1 hypothetical protein DV711_06450 [Motiliproteus coralliicola]
MSGHGELNRALKVHSELCRLIRPVTPESIRASRVKDNLTLQGLILAGLISFVLFVLPLATPNLPQFVQILGAAGLGSTFHALYTANKYLHRSTFNPKYNQKYIINFALGLFAGSILGMFGTDLLAKQQTSFFLTPSLLALVGGFSAEAVAQILQRIADTLVTMVKGSSRDKNQVKTDKAITRANGHLASKLHQALEGDEQQVRQNVEKLLKELLNQR